MMDYIKYIFCCVKFVEYCLLVNMSKSGLSVLFIYLSILSDNGHDTESIVLMKWSGANRSQFVKQCWI